MANDAHPSWRDHLTAEERAWIEADDRLMAEIQRMRDDATKFRRQKIINRAIHRARATRQKMAVASHQPATSNGVTDD